MADTGEPTAVPDEIIEPIVSYEVVQETYEAPTASFESLHADTSKPQASMDTITFSEQARPYPNIDLEKKSIQPEE